MKIRLATHHDAPQLAELLKHWDRHEFESERYANRRGPNGPGTHVAERDGTIVGSLTGSHANENANEMGDYADRPNWRCSVLLAMYVDVAHQDDGVARTSWKPSWRRARRKATSWPTSTRMPTRTWNGFGASRSV